MVVFWWHWKRIPGKLLMAHCVYCTVCKCDRLSCRHTWWANTYHLLMQSWCQPKNIKLVQPCCLALSLFSFLDFLSIPVRLLSYCYTVLKLIFSPAYFIILSVQFTFSVLDFHTCLMPPFSVHRHRAGKSELFLHLKRKKGQAESGADRTKPLPLWCVYRVNVTGMSERERVSRTLFLSQRAQTHVIILNAHKKYSVKLK